MSSSNHLLLPLYKVSALIVLLACQFSPMEASLSDVQAQVGCFTTEQRCFPNMAYPCCGGKYCSLAWSSFMTCVDCIGQAEFCLTNESCCSKQCKWFRCRLGDGMSEDGSTSSSSESGSSGHNMGSSTTSGPDTSLDSGACM